MSRIEADRSRAWTWHGPGEPETLRLETRPVPQPAPGEALVANRAVGLNPVDWKVVAHGHEAWRPGHVPGVDGAGIVAAVGEGVRLPIGLRVAYHQALDRDGSFSEFTCVDAHALLSVPDALDDVSAAALPCPGLTAWQAAAKLTGAAGRDVLVTGAGGAVGLLAIQCGVQLGWRVWATGAPRHHAALKDLGVVETFDYRDAAWPDRLAAALGPRRLHAIIDTVDSAGARALAPLIGYNGHLVYVMYRQEELPMPVFTTALSVHEVALNCIHAHGTAADWRELRGTGARLFAGAATGEVRLPAITTVAFDDLPRALTRLRDGRAEGKLVLHI